MPKATVTMLSGATVAVEGTAEEVAALVMRLESPAGDGGRGYTHDAPRHQGKVTPMALISGLIGEGFFREPRELGAVGSSLKERGHHYPTTTLSPVMLRLVRKKELRRIKEKGRWAYVG